MGRRWCLFYSFIFNPNLYKYILIETQGLIYNLSCGYFAGKARGPNKKSIWIHSVFSWSFVQFCLNSRGSSHTAQQQTCPPPLLIGFLCWFRIQCLTQTVVTQMPCYHLLLPCLTCRNTPTSNTNSPGSLFAVRYPRQVGSMFTVGILWLSIHRISSVCFNKLTMEKNTSKHEHQTPLNTTCPWRWHRFSWPHS